MPIRRFLVSLLSVSLLLAAAAAPSAFAKAEEVAYRCDLDICLTDPDGAPGNFVDLTDNGEDSLDQHPQWSPDGTRVAFVGTDPKEPSNRTQNIYVMEPGKGEASNIATQLTFYKPGSVAGIEGLEWSPDGAHIAYERTPSYGAHAEIFVVSADGTTAEPLKIAADGYHPSWAPDGGKIAYSSYAEQIYLGNANGSGSQELADGKGIEPAWSPDGSQIAFGRGAYAGDFVELHINSAGCGASPVLVPKVESSEYTQWIDAVWSPDGGRVAYRATFEGGSGFYRVVGRYGGASVFLPKVMGVNMGGGIPPSWSPDGQRLTFQGYSFATKPPTNEIYVGNANGSGSVTTIGGPGGKNHEPDWRPDPLVTPHVPVICRSVPETTPGGATTGPRTSGQKKPQRVWFTKRIPITASAPIHMMSVGCSAPRCNAGGTGSSRASAPAGLRLATVSKKKPKSIVVGSGKLKLREGQTKTLLMYLNKAGKALLERQGKLDIQATVKITSVGQATEVLKKTLHVVLAKPKKKKH